MVIVSVFLIANRANLYNPSFRTNFLLCLLIFPEGKINRYGRKLVLKEGLYRLARLASKKTETITIIPIGIAYSKVSPEFRSEFCLSFGKPIVMNDYLNLNILEFNKFLYEKMQIVF